ncbi:glycosyltransferase family 4 protein [Rhodopila sp.]|uniref:glycosyltransferase family 4 protein n=1 Tax=Rhodopila sp. TaxID=2480087 RepID=UPI003D0CDEC4
MSPPVLLDLSRLVSRASRPTPTGIDRIELAYAEHLIDRAGDRVSFVAMNAAGDIAPLRTRYGRLLVDALARCWRDPDESGRAARRLGMLARMSGLMPGQRLLPPAARGSRRRPVYLLVSHQNLHRAARLARFKVRSGAAFVFFVHDLIPMDYPEYARPGQAERHRQRIETICALADGVVANSQATADSLAPYIARAGRHIPVLVAHPGAEFATHCPSSCNIPSTAADGTPYFACIGTIEPRKNHLLLLHLWRCLAARADAATPRLKLIGQRGWENENIVDIIDRCTAISGLLEEHNTLPDRELRPLLAGARALLCPAFVEGYGLPIAEALALGVPVICSDIPVFREVGRDVPEFLDPLDGLGWLQAIRDYSAADSPRRAAQLARLPAWHAPRWEPHIDAVIELIEQISPEAAPLPWQENAAGDLPGKQAASPRGLKHHHGARSC